MVNDKRYIDKNVLDIAEYINQLNTAETLLLVWGLYGTYSLACRMKTRKNSIKLSREIKINKETKINITKLKKENIDEEEKNIFAKYEYREQSEKCTEIIRLFKMKLKGLLSKEDYFRITKKLDTVLVEFNKKDSTLAELKADGCYNFGNHKIIVLDFKKIDNNKIKLLFHEILHASSASFYLEDRVVLSGFKRYYLEDDLRYGVGLNEGYTENLTKKLTGESNGSYKYLENVSSIVEGLVGSKMISYYFNNQLSELVDHLSIYSSKQQLEQFIINLDFMYEYNDMDSDINGKVKNEVNKYFEEIQTFLLDCYYNKLRLEESYDIELYENILRLKDKQFLTVHAAIDTLKNVKKKKLIKN